MACRKYLKTAAWDWEHAVIDIDGTAHTVYLHIYLYIHMYRYWCARMVRGPSFMDVAFGRLGCSGCYFSF